jgi:hypothetical protein
MEPTLPRPSVSAVLFDTWRSSANWKQPDANPPGGHGDGGSGLDFGAGNAYLHKKGSQLIPLQTLDGGFAAPRG